MTPPPPFDSALLERLPPDAIDRSGALVVVANDAGDILACNQAAADRAGVSFDQATGRPFESFLFDDAEIAATKAALRAVTSDGLARGLANRWRGSGGVDRMIAWSLARIDDGAARYVLATGVDITDQGIAERAAAEGDARLRSIFETAVDGIIMIDERGAIEMFSPSAERLFGYTPAEVIGRNVSILMPEPDRHRHDGYISRYLSTGQKRIIGVGRTVEGRRKDGGVVPLDLAVSEIIVSGKRKFTAILRDLSHERAREAALHQAQKMEAVGQLTGGVAHDFNNLLTVIIGNLEMLDALAAGEEATECVRDAMEAAELGARLTNRLLAFARRQPLEPAVTDINELVIGVTDLLRRTLGENISISTVLATDLPKVLVDRAQFENAILNLAINARDAMPKGGNLTIETALEEAAGPAVQADQGSQRWVTLTVADTGAGMTPEIRERAFEPFFTTKQAGAGTGLGLSTVYGLAKQSGGDVHLVSEVGRGTTVVVTLPEHLADRTEAPIEEPAPAMIEETGLNESILVVEDNPRVRAVTVRRLRQLGYAVLEAPDGKTALEAIDGGEHVDLVLSDIVMPGGMTGPDLAREIKRREPNMKVVLTTGYTETAIEDGLPAGADEIIRKPYSRKTLAERLRAVLGRRA